MAKNQPSARQPEEDNGEQPSLQDLLKAARQIDENVDEEAQRKLKLEAMADHGLTDPDASKPAKSSSKKQDEALAAANEKNTALQDEMAELRTRLAQLESNKPVEQDAQIPAAPIVPPAPVATEANPFAGGTVPQ